MRHSKKLKISNMVSVYEGENRYLVGTGTVIKIDGDLITIRRGNGSIFQAWVGDNEFVILL